MSTLAAMLLHNRTSDQTLRLLACIDHTKNQFISPTHSISTAECSICFEQFSSQNPAVFPNCQIVTNLTQIPKSNFYNRIRAAIQHAPVHQTCIQTLTNQGICNCDATPLAPVQPSSPLGQRVFYTNAEVNINIKQVVDTALRNSSTSDALLIAILPELAPAPKVPSSPSIIINPAPLGAGVADLRADVWDRIKFIFWHAIAALAIIVTGCYFLNQLLYGGSNRVLSIIGAPAHFLFNSL